MKNQGLGVDHTDTYYVESVKSMAYRADEQPEIQAYNDADEFFKSSSLSYNSSSPFSVYISQIPSTELGHHISLPADEDDLSEYMKLLGQHGGDVIATDWNFPAGMNALGSDFMDIKQLNELVWMIEEDYSIDYARALVASGKYLTLDYFAKALEQNKASYLEYEEQAWDWYAMSEWGVTQQIIDAGILDYDQIGTAWNSNTGGVLVEVDGSFFAVR